MDLDLGTAIQELFSQAMDIDLDSVRSHIACETENLVLHQFFRYDIAFAPHQKFEHRCFTG
jgi:hypothetical protein